MPSCLATFRLTTSVNFTGSFDEVGELVMLGSTNNGSQSCGSGNPVGRLTEEQFMLTFSDAENFSGRYVFTATANDPFCNCAKIFDVSGFR